MLYASDRRDRGIPYEWMTPAEIKEALAACPHRRPEGRDLSPTDGYINPADVTMAMAKGARQRGVSIERKWQVDGYAWTGAEWRVSVTKMVEKGGNLVPSEENRRHHRRACGHRHRQPRPAHRAGSWGSKIPRDPGRAAVYRDRARPGAGQWRARGQPPSTAVLRDADAKMVCRREERKGWILGPYESNGAPACFEYDVPDKPSAPTFPRFDLERDRGGIHEHDPRASRTRKRWASKDDFKRPESATRPTATRLGRPCAAPAQPCGWPRDSFRASRRRAAPGNYHLAQMMVEGEGRDRQGAAGPQTLRVRG